LRAPEFERLGRLNIIVAIDDEMTLSFFRARRLGNDDWISGSFMRGRCQANRFAMFTYPLRTLYQVGLMLSLRRDTREAHILTEVRHKTCFVFPQIIQDFFHFVMGSYFSKFLSKSSGFGLAGFFSAGAPFVFAEALLVWRAS